MRRGQLDMKCYLTIIFFSIWSADGQAFDLQGYGGRQVIQNNSLFQSEDGEGAEYGGRLLGYPGGQSFFEVGAFYSKVQYNLQSTHAFEGIVIAGSGDFDGDYFGPCIRLTAPIPYLTFYSGFSYMMGTYQYQFSKTSDLTATTGDKFSEWLRSEVHLKSLGLNATLGIRTRGKYSFFAEVGESFQTLTITAVKVNATNYINGAIESEDSGETPYEESFDGLVAQSLNFSTRSLLGGLEISL